MTFTNYFGILFLGDIMIFDTLNNIENYKGLGRVYTALQFLKNTDFNKIELGKYELDGDNIFYMVQSYETDPNKTIAEAHKKYIDIFPSLLYKQKYLVQSIYESMRPFSLQGSLSTLSWKL